MIDSDAKEDSLDAIGLPWPYGPGYHERLEQATQLLQSHLRVAGVDHPMFIRTLDKELRPLGFAVENWGGRAQIVALRGVAR